jgi:hypothetical protein
MVFSDSDDADEIEKFLSANGTAEMARNIRQGIEQIRLSAAWKQRDEATIINFMKNQTRQA